MERSAPTAPLSSTLLFLLGRFLRYAAEITACCQHWLHVHIRPELADHWVVSGPGTHTSVLITYQCTNIRI
jgi:hypothetical protein